MSYRNLDLAIGQHLPQMMNAVTGHFERQANRKFVEGQQMREQRESAFKNVMSNLQVTANERNMSIDQLIREDEQALNDLLSVSDVATRDMLKMSNRELVDYRGGMTAVRMDDGRFAIGVRRKDGADGIITQRGSADDDDPAQMFTRDELIDQMLRPALMQRGLIDMNRTMQVALGGVELEEVRGDQVMHLYDVQGNEIPMGSEEYSRAVSYISQVQNDSNLTPEQAASFVNQTLETHRQVEADEAEQDRIEQEARDEAAALDGSSDTRDPSKPRASGADINRVASQDPIRQNLREGFYNSLTEVNLPQRQPARTEPGEGVRLDDVSQMRRRLDAIQDRYLELEQQGAEPGDPELQSLVDEATVLQADIAESEGNDVRLDRVQSTRQRLDAMAPQQRSPGSRLPAEESIADTARRTADEGISGGGAPMSQDEFLAPLRTDIDTGRNRGIQDPTRPAPDRLGQSELQRDGVSSSWQALLSDEARERIAARNIPETEIPFIAEGVAAEPRSDQPASLDDEAPPATMQALQSDAPLSGTGKVDLGGVEVSRAVLRRQPTRVIANPKYTLAQQATASALLYKELNGSVPAGLIDRFRAEANPQEPTAKERIDLLRAEVQLATDRVKYAKAIEELNQMGAADRRRAEERNREMFDGAMDDFITALLPQIRDPNYQEADDVAKAKLRTHMTTAVTENRAMFEGLLGYRYDDQGFLDTSQNGAAEAVQLMKFLAAPMIFDGQRRVNWLGSETTDVQMGQINLSKMPVAPGRPELATVNRNLEYLRNHDPARFAQIMQQHTPEQGSVQDQWLGAFRSIWRNPPQELLTEIRPR